MREPSFLAEGVNSPMPVGSPTTFGPFCLHALPDYVLAPGQIAHDLALIL